MSIIPVIDLLGGQVVRAVRGDRLAYKPIESALCRSADPRVVARVLCEYTASRVLYVADLDALLGRAPQVDLVTELLEEFPDMLLWLDAGFRDRASADGQLAVLGSVAARVEPVFGSESLASRPAFEQCFAEGASGLLSLDRRGSQPLDPSGCWELPSLWPRHSEPLWLSTAAVLLSPRFPLASRVPARAVTTDLIPPRTLKSPTTSIQRGAHAFTRSSRIVFTVLS